jgi:methionine-gamma-lyase
VGFQTDCTTTGEDRRLYHGSVAPPIFAASLFTAPTWSEFEDAFASDPPQRFVYTRGLNPTCRALEAKLAILERTEECKFFGSGMAAISAVMLHCVRAGQHLVAPKGIYNHTYKLLTNYLPDLGIETTFVDMTNVGEVEAAIRPTTRLLYVESPANPTMQITDLAAIVEIGRRRGVCTAIDNSLATPFNQRPAELGIDFVIHTATKYLAGHSDVVAGAVAGSRDRIVPLITREHADLGGILGPFEAWLVLRGMRTLGLRMERHNQSALEICEFLRNHQRVEQVFHPSCLAMDEQQALYHRQMTGGSGLIGFKIRGGASDAERLVDGLSLFSIAVSWGGFESLALPMWETSPMPEERRRAIGLTEGFVRLSIGLEDVDDLIADLDQALARLP